jgi:probable HAF family extracellular repeat protein
LWQEGQAFDLGTLPGGDFSQAFAVNENEQIVGRWGNENTGPIHGFIWREGKMFDLGPDLGTKSSNARDVNDAGAVVGWMGTSFLIDSHAFIWQDGTVNDLGVIPGGFTAFATAISNLGHVVGSGAVPADGYPFGVSRAFYWHDGKMINIGTLPGYDLSAALDVNDNGLVVGRTWAGSEPETAFVWHDGVMTDLNTLLPPDTDVEIAVAWAVNNKGQIAGEGRNLEGDVLGVVLTPIESPLGDLTCDGRVLLDDLTILLNTWGPCPGCPADFDDDGIVGVADLLTLLFHWG